MANGESQIFTKFLNYFTLLFAYIIYMLYICTVSNKQKTNIMTIQDLTQEYNRLEERKKIAEDWVIEYREFHCVTCGSKNICESCKRL